MKPHLPVPHAEYLHNPIISFAAGGGLTAVLAVAGIWTVPHASTAYAITAVGAMLGERASIRVQWRDKQLAYTLASPFVLAILALWGLPAALVAATAASLLDDIVDRSSLPKTAFNLGQAGLALGVAGGVYALLADGPITSWRQLPAFGAAAVVNLALSEVAVRAVVALERQTASAAHLLESTTLSALTAVLNAGLTGAVLLAVPNKLLVPVILGTPILPVYLACRTATRERQARAIAETNQLKAETAQNVAEKAQAEAEAARADAEHDRAEAQRQATERARLLEVTRQLVRRLHAKDRHSHETMALVAYELQDPLRMLTGVTASLINTDHRLGPKARQEFHTTLLRNAEQATAAAQRLQLDVPHHRTQPPAKPAMTVIDAAELIRSVGQLAAVIYDDRPVEVHAAQPLLVRACPEVIDRILSLVLDNVDCHTPARSPIRVEAVRRGDDVVLAVQDRGPGIPLPDRDRIFDQFIRLRGKGLGVGLHMARVLAREQSGELAAVDPHGGENGARLELTLPSASQMLHRR